MLDLAAILMAVAPAPSPPSLLAGVARNITDRLRSPVSPSTGHRRWSTDTAIASRVRTHEGTASAAARWRSTVKGSRDDSVAAVARHPFTLPQEELQHMKSAANAATAAFDAAGKQRQGHAVQVAATTTPASADEEAALAESGRNWEKAHPTGNSMVLKLLRKAKHTPQTRLQRAESFHDTMLPLAVKPLEKPVMTQASDAVWQVKPQQSISAGKASTVDASKAALPREGSGRREEEEKEEEEEEEEEEEALQASAAQWHRTAMKTLRSPISRASTATAISRMKESHLKSPKAAAASPLAAAASPKAASRKTTKAAASSRQSQPKAWAGGSSSSSPSLLQPVEATLPLLPTSPLPRGRTMDWHCTPTSALPPHFPTIQLQSPQRSHYDPTMTSSTASLQPQPSSNDRLRHTAFLGAVSSTSQPNSSHSASLFAPPATIGEAQHSSTFSNASITGASTIQYRNIQRSRQQFNDSLWENDLLEPGDAEGWAPMVKEPTRKAPGTASENGKTKKTPFGAFGTPSALWRRAITEVEAEATKAPPPSRHRSPSRSTNRPPGLSLNSPQSTAAHIPALPLPSVQQSPPLRKPKKAKPRTLPKPKPKPRAPREIAVGPRFPWEKLPASAQRLFASSILQSP